MSFRPSEINRYLTSLFGSRSNPVIPKEWSETEAGIQEAEIKAKREAIREKNKIRSNDEWKEIAKEIQREIDEKILKDLKAVHGITIGSIGSGPLGLGPIKDTNQCDNCYYFNEIKSKCFYHNKQIAEESNFTCTKWREKDDN